MNGGICKVLMKLLLAVLLVSCGTVRKTAEVPEESALSVEDQRRYEYYYLEAVRLEQQGCYEHSGDFFTNVIHAD